MKINNDPDFQKAGQQAAEAFRTIFNKMCEDIPQNAVLSGLAACLAERGIALRPQGMSLEQAVEETDEMLQIYLAQVVMWHERQEDAA